MGPDRTRADAAANILIAGGNATDAVAGAMRALGSTAAASYGAALAVLCAVTTRAAGREIRSLEDAIAWSSTLPEGALLVRLLAAVDHSGDALAGAVLLHVARAVAERALRGGESPAFADAPVDPLERVVVGAWKQQRRTAGHEWLYHPRKPDLSHLVVKRFLTDMLAVSPEFRADAHAGRVAVDLNTTVASGQRHKKLDLVVGAPADPIGPADDDDNPVRKARIGDIMLTLEIKACMTSHRQATPRLLDELRSSVEVVKAMSPAAIPVAIVLVNVSPKFTNPLNLPGPNEHLERDIERLFHRLVERVRLDRGGGADLAYGGLGIVVVDTDNERRIHEGSRGGRVPPTHTYERALGRAAALYARQATRAAPR